MSVNVTVKSLENGTPLALSKAWTKLGMQGVSVEAGELPTCSSSDCMVRRALVTGPLPLAAASMPSVAWGKPLSAHYGGAATSACDGQRLSQAYRSLFPPPPPSFPCIVSKWMRCFARRTTSLRNFKHARLAVFFARVSSVITARGFKTMYGRVWKTTRTR